MTWCNFNGKLYKENEDIISAGSRGLRYGDGLFETMKLVNGTLVLADEHFSRLWKGLRALQFELPKHFTPERLAKEIKSLAKKNQHHQQARVRLTVLRGPGGLYDPLNHHPNYIIETWLLPPENGLLNSNGLVLGIYNEVKKSCDLLSNLKHNNFLPYVMAALHAKKQKWNDAVLLNTHGRICDTTIANIFLVKNETVYTPPLSEGCIAGVMRAQLLPVLKESAIACVQKEITTGELMDADEVFVTNSIFNLRWVRQIENKAFGSHFTQKIFSALMPTIS